jgi:hypothetical protein
MFSHSPRLNTTALKYFLVQIRKTQKRDYGVPRVVELARRVAGSEESPGGGVWAQNEFEQIMLEKRFQQ